MQNLDKRVTALESKQALPIRWVWRNAGETQAAALERAGIARESNVIIFSWKGQHENN